MSFKSLLDKLRLSSREAIVNGQKKSNNKLKNYLHIERQVERDLSSLISKAYEANRPQLILIMGNVGDGKSHLLSRMWDKHFLEMPLFNVHNDATESISKKKTYLQTLKEVLDPYSDLQIENLRNKQKTIIAINLGTLANFLDYEGDNFKTLKKFIDENKLLNESTPFLKPQESLYFNYINLADYHIFSLEEVKTISYVSIEIIKKITQKTKDNPFFEAYQEYYKQHPSPHQCPLKYNFDLLSQDHISKKIAELIVQVLIKDKQIVSVRLLMNFIYDIIVPASLSNLSDEEIIKKIKSNDFEKDFYKYIIPTILFESPNTSYILKYINIYDPISQPNEVLDSLIVKLGSTTDPLKYFLDYHILSSSDILYNKIASIPPQEIIKLFIRLNFLNNSAPELHTKDSVFEDYVRNLYYYNSGQTNKLKLLYEITQHAIYQWNGTAKEANKYINLELRNNQTKYKISQELFLEPAPIISIPSKEKSLEKFSKSIRLQYRIKGEKEVFPIDITYDLYLLIRKITKGYRANRIDKLNHVDFSQFVDKLSSFNASNKDLLIQYHQGEIHRKFQLTFDAGFETFQFEEK